MRQAPSTPTITANALIRAALFAAVSMASLGSSAAFAGVSASAYVEDERVHRTLPDAALGSVTATQAEGIAGSSHFASASADSSAGVLKATAQAGLDGAYIMPATAVTQIQEDIMFSGGFGGTAYLDWSFHGDITLANSPYSGPGNAAAFGQFNIYAATVFGSYSEYTTLAPPNFACGAGCVEGTSIERTGTVAIPINEYGATIYATLSTFATFGNLADFGNTSKLYLRLPDGVTFTSTSGQFLSNAQPIFAVPEPQTYALLLAGLAVIGAVTRRRHAGS